MRECISFVLSPRTVVICYSSPEKLIQCVWEAVKRPVWLKTNGGHVRCTWIAAGHMRYLTTPRSLTPSEMEHPRKIWGGGMPWSDGWSDCEHHCFSSNLPRPLHVAGTQQTSILPSCHSWGSGLGAIKYMCCRWGEGRVTWFLEHGACSSNYNI